MKLKYILPLIVFAASSTTAAAGNNFASGNGIAGEIAPYVYPENRAASPAEMVFMPDGLSYLMANDDNTRILRYNTESGKEIETVFDVATARESKIKSFEGFSVSENGAYLLLYTDKEPVYRRSFRAVYYTYELRHNILRPLSDKFPLQQSPVVSPDGRAVAFVADNNIYMRKLDYNTEVQVTTDGAINSIINGTADWTYEEEFATTCSMIFSPDSRMLCYLKFNEEAVPTYSFPLYQGTCDPLNQYALYPGEMAYKYPVAGEKNSAVTLHSYDLSNRKTLDIPFPDGQIEYIPRIIFTPVADCLLAVTLNRDQNRMEIYSVNPRSTTVKSLLVEESKAWIDPCCYENIVTGSNSFVVNSSRTGFNHLYEYSYAGAFVRQITSGDFDVTECYGIDAASNVYYQSAAPTPLNRRVEKCDAKGRTTILSAEGGTASATFSPSLSHCVMRRSTVATPPVYTLCNASGKQLRVLEDNSAYAARYSNLPTKEFFTFNSEGYELNGYMIKPTDFNPSHKYPVIMWQYSGPGSQQVADSWVMDWDYYAAQQGFIVVCVDGRGTGYRGRAFMDVVYKNLGYYETIDQLNAAAYVASLPFVDPDRIGIAGWSYGGYETLMCATAPSAPFAAAVAIAPVTDWRYYDTVYAERYMQTPRQNEDGYNDSAPLNRTRNLRCPLLIMHGTADDNVHLSNTMEFVSRLQSNGLFCDMFLFPNMNHSIFGCNARAVVYGRMIDYFSRSME